VYSKYKCDKCRGKGRYYVPNEGLEAISVRCSKCDGDGYLDWVENVVGKTPRRRATDSSSAIGLTATEVAIAYPRMHGKSSLLKAQVSIERELIQIMSNKIAIEIDKEILESLGVKEVK